MPNPLMRDQFIDALTHYLVDREAHKSILVQMGTPEGIAWRGLRNRAPLNGYYSGGDGFERARREMRIFLTGFE